MDFKRPPKQSDQMLTPRPSEPIQPPQSHQQQLQPEQPVYADRQLSSGLPQGPLAVETSQTVTNDTENQNKPKKPRKKILLILITIISLLAIIIAGAIGWYFWSLKPVSSQGESKQFEIVSGATPSMIGEGLKNLGVIRSSTVFLINTRLQGVQGSLQAGMYTLNTADSTEQIVAKLVGGPEDTSQDITFLPGETIEDHKKVLIAAGYSEQQVKQAFEKKYDHQIFATKPDAADLEGYIYGETHRFDKGTSLDVVLKRYFDDFGKVVEQNDLVSKYEAQGLSLFEGITLASIIEREVSCGDSQVCDDQRKVAQVFFKRMKQNMSLGADATFMYAAKKEGKTPTVNFDSLYNTRIHRGLPPGPISTPGLGALLAVADPSDGDYLYFVSGDDDVNYFSRTEEEHIDLTNKHCRIKCQLP